MAGTGLGTFGFVQMPYITPDKVWYIAHNDYAQVFAEAGIVGVAWLILIFALLSFAATKTSRLQGTERALAAGAWPSLAGIGHHSLFDWNFHLPANGLLAYLLIGLAFAIVPAKPLQHTTLKQKRLTVPSFGVMMVNCPWTPFRVGIVATATASYLLTAYYSYRDVGSEDARMRLQTALVNARTASTEDQGLVASEQLKRGIAFARSAYRHHMTDSEIPMLTGQALLHLEATGEKLDGEDAARWFFEARCRNPLRRGASELIPPTP